MSRELSSLETAKLKMLYTNYSPVMFEGAIREKFEEIYHDIKVGVRDVPYEVLHDEIVANMMAGGTEYDVFMIDNIWLPEFVEAGWLAEVTEYITPEIKQNISPNALKAAEYPPGSERYYGWPWYVDAKYLFYNEKMLSKAGIRAPPTTLAELWNQAMVIKNKGILKYPFAWSWAQHECLICDFTILTALFGGRLVDEAGKPVFNKGGAVDALKWMMKTIDAGLTSWASLAFKETDVTRILCTEDAAFTLSWLPEYEDVNRPEFLAGACKITHIPGRNILPEGISVNGSDLLGISSSSKNKDAAVEFIKFWTGVDKQKSYANWLAPSWLRLLDTPKIFRDGIFNILDVVEYQYKHMITRPRIPKYTVFSKELQLAIHEALLKLKSPEEALNDAAKRLTT